MTRDSDQEIDSMQVTTSRGLQLAHVEFPRLSLSLSMGAM